MSQDTHPCLCDICLRARDDEIRRVRKNMIKDIEGVIGEDEIRDFGYKNGYHDYSIGIDFRNELRKEQRAKLKTLSEGKE